MDTVRSVLIIDDHAPDTEFCKLMLERSGRFHKVYSAETAEGALEEFRNYQEAHQTDPARFPPIVVLLDINMPGMNGFEFLESYEPLRPKISELGVDPTVVIMLTTSNNPEDRERASTFDCVKGFITKPLTVQEAHRIADGVAELD